MKESQAQLTAQYAAANERVERTHEALYAADMDQQPALQIVADAALAARKKVIEKIVDSSYYRDAQKRAYALEKEIHVKWALRTAALEEQERAKKHFDAQPTNRNAKENWERADRALEAANTACRAAMKELDIIEAQIDNMFPAIPSRDEE